MNFKGVLLAALAIALPISIFITDIIIFLFLFIWLVEGDFIHKYQRLKNSKWIISLLLFFLVYLIGMFWGTNHLGANWVFQKTAILLLLPILYSLKFTDKQLKNSAIAFIISVTFSAIIALFINIGWLENLFKYSSVFSKNWNIPAFMVYTDHNIYLSMCILLCLMFLLNNINNKPSSFWLIICVALSVLSLFTEKGRAGQMAFLLLCSLFFIFSLHRKKQLLIISLIAIILVPITAYYSSPTFNKRINITIANLNELDQTQSNSLNSRYFLTKYSIDKIKKNPIFGYGTGSFVAEFSSISPHAKTIINEVHKTPHNNYLFVWFEVGLIGLFVFLSIFFFQIKEYIKQPMGTYRIIFPIIFIFIMLFDAYIQNHNPAALYAYLSVIFARYSFK